MINDTGTINDVTLVLECKQCKNALTLHNLERFYKTNDLECPICSKQWWGPSKPGAADDETASFVEALRQVLKSPSDKVNLMLTFPQMIEPLLGRGA